jgi:hypothetical protein
MGRVADKSNRVMGKVLESLRKEDRGADTGARKVYYFLGRATGRSYYPKEISRAGDPEESPTMQFLKATECREIAEIVIFEGDTSKAIARWLGGNGHLHLFDFDDKIAAVESELSRAGHNNVVYYPNSRRILDSYNWSLKRGASNGCWMSTPNPSSTTFFAHTWAFDPLAYLFADRLLKLAATLTLTTTPGPLRTHHR